MTHNIWLPLALLAVSSAAAQEPRAVAVESGGLVEVEAEDFTSQEKTEVRKWHIQRTGHAAKASGGAYIEVLPDTRRTHDDKLVAGENFSNTPGAMAVVHYPIRFTTPGRYHVWVRAYSTGPEDNGIHVGINGTWPESGRRMQWCEGKNAWTYASKQRTEKVHCGEPGLIYLDVKEPGVHTVSFSMREDGFDFDKFILATTAHFVRKD